MATGAANGMFRSIFEGCISGRDAAIERRPYHKNCGCALHERSSGAGKTQRRICRHGSSESISYPIRRSWSEGNLGLHLSSSSSSSSSSNLQSLSASYSLSNIASPSPSGSPAAVAMDSSRYSHHLWWTIDEEEAHNS